MSTSRRDSEESSLFPDGALRGEEGQCAGLCRPAVDAQLCDGRALHPGRGLWDGLHKPGGSALLRAEDQLDGLQFLVSEDGSKEPSLCHGGALFPCGALHESTHQFGELGGGLVVNGSLEGPWKLEVVGDYGVQPTLSSSMRSSGLHPAEGQHARPSSCNSGESMGGKKIFSQGSHNSRMGAQTSLPTTNQIKDETHEGTNFSQCEHQS